MGWAFIRGCALVKFFCLYDGRLISMWILRLGGDRKKKSEKVQFCFSLRASSLGAAKNETVLSLTYPNGVSFNGNTIVGF